jgi:hypothetical protein
MSHLFYNFKKNRETQKIQENELPSTPFEKLKMKDFIHVIMLFYIIHQAHQRFQEMHQKEQLPKEEGN